MAFGNNIEMLPEIALSKDKFSGLVLSYLAEACNFFYILFCIVVLP